MSDIPYPFGIGPDCFRQGFDLTCNHSTKHPRLFLGSSTIQVTDIDAYSGVVSTPIIYNLTTMSGTNTYDIMWKAPAKGEGPRPGDGSGSNYCTEAGAGTGDGSAVVLDQKLFGGWMISIAWTMRRSSSACEQRGRRRSRDWSTWEVE
ncbi:uncharacterized protein LOC119324732 [Triticum dicoccoides]|uniref:uncharacterized protein LOC119324732 n=1 Tax=Triticum dicoccoides TaxID=85692 RepID=UPI00189178FB|nr:uncharacterized protein LOC119324732 [Triticum dicoccoides]